MLEKTLRKLRSEIDLLVFIVIISLVVSSSMIADATIALRNYIQYGPPSLAFRICELAVAVTWLSLSTKIARETYRLRKKHYKIFFLRRLEKLDEEQKKSETTELIRDIVAFYRGYYKRTMIMLMLAAVVGLSIVATITYLLLYGYMSFWEAVFRWGIDSLMLLSAFALYVYLHRSWGRKLLKIKNAEKKLSEILGGHVEA